jgi:single-strand DNA-binding protein
MSFEVEGKLYKVYPTEQKTATFQTRDFGLEIMSGNYPQYIKFQLTQDKCAVLDSFNEGDAIKVHFDLRGREWQGKILSNLNAWRVEAASLSAGSSNSAPKMADAPAYTDDSFAGLGNEPIMPVQDDLPF